MVNAFEAEPHLATDALVLGHSFKSPTSRGYWGLGVVSFGVAPLQEKWCLLCGFAVIGPVKRGGLSSLNTQTPNTTDWPLR